MDDIEQLKKRVKKAQDNFNKFGAIYWYGKYAKSTMELLQELMDEVELLDSTVSVMRYAQDME